MRIEVAVGNAFTGASGLERGFISWTVYWSCVPRVGDEFSFLWPDDEDGKTWVSRVESVSWSIADSLEPDGLVTIWLAQPFDADADATADTAPTSEHDAPHE